MQTTKILLIEDDREDVELVAELLQELPQARIQLESSRSLAQGLERLAKGQIDVVFLDLSLPDAQGLGICRQVQAQEPHLPIIILSGLDDEEVAIAALQEGAQDYLVKGKFDSYSFVKAIRYSIERKRLQLAMKQQNAAVKTSEEQFRSLINRNADAMLVVNSQGVIQFANPAVAELFDRRTQNLIGREFGFPLVTGESTEIDIVRQTEVITAEMRLAEITWEGESAYLASLRDITWRKQAETTLKRLNDNLETQVSERTVALKQTNKQLLTEITERQRSEALLRTVVTGAPIILWSVNREGTITLAEGKGLAALALKPEAIVGRSIFEFSRLYPEMSEKHRRVLAGAETQWRVEINQLVYECRATPIARQGTVVGLIGVATDITERVLAETQRDKLLESERTAREEAEQANRLKDEFLAVLSHELRTPLNPIVGWTSLLRKGNVSAEQTERALETIERNAQLQTQLIDDLLDISRILRGKLQLQSLPLKLPPIIEAAIETVRLAAQAKSIQIVTNYQSREETILGDPDRLQQVVWNLLTNAVKFTPAGGQITVQLFKRDSRMTLQVVDTGNGIDQQFIPYLFDKFRQENSSTTRTFGGLGLGLAIVRHLVELHGGTVSAQSLGKGQGSTFTVNLPRIQQPLAPKKPPSLQTDGLSLEGVRLLVVDDEADSLEITTLWLEQHGAQVTAVTKAQEALTSFDAEQPDVLISDIGMPEIDGNELIQTIRRKSLAAGGNIKAIALTAYATEADKRKILAAGFDCHLSKPIKPSQLITQVAMLVRRFS
ncbi:MAG: response regulator [Cyanophyceae cyanobacterium]